MENPLLITQEEYENTVSSLRGQTCSWAVISTLRYCGAIEEGTYPEYLDENGIVVLAMTVRNLAIRVAELEKKLNETTNT